MVKKFRIFQLLLAIFLIGMSWWLHSNGQNQTAWVVALSGTVAILPWSKLFIGKLKDQIWP